LVGKNLLINCTPVEDKSLMRVPPDSSFECLWRQSAQYWEKHRQVIRQMFVPVTQALIEEAEIVRGFHVLDVGTGTGEPALTIAELVGNEGRVCGIDPAPEMIAAARRAAADEKFDSAQFEVSPADNLPFPSETFDAVASRFAAMFFPDPPEAIREILRVLKPRRRAAFAVWSFADSNPLHYVVTRIFDRYIAPPPLPPGAPDMFCFAAPGKLRTILEEAGAVQPVERLFRFDIEALLSVEDFWQLRLDMSEKLRSKLATASEETKAQVSSEVIDALREYSDEKKMSFPAEVLLVSGTKA
jgi:enediyne biosynthesis protein CalE5